MLAACNLCRELGQPPLAGCVPTSGAPRLGGQKSWGISQGWGRRKDYVLSRCRIPPTSQQDRWDSVLGVRAGEGTSGRRNGVDKALEVGPQWGVLDTFIKSPL